MPQLVDRDWKPSSELMRLDWETDGLHVRILIGAVVASYLLFPAAAAAPERRCMQAALSWKSIEDIPNHRSEGVYERLVAYHLHPIGDRRTLAEAESLRSYFSRFDWRAIICVGSSVRFIRRCVDHHNADFRGGMSLGKARDYAWYKLNVNRNDFREYWHELAPVAHICAALVHLSDAVELADKRGRLLRHWTSPDRVFELLEVAADFGTFLCSFYVQRRPDPLIARETLWGLSSIVGDLPIDLELPPLDPAELTWMKDRRAVGGDEKKGSSSSNV